MHIDFLFDFEIDVRCDVHLLSCSDAHQTKPNHVASAFTSIIGQYINIKLVSKSKEYFSWFVKKQFITSIMNHDDRVVIVLSFAIIHMKV